MLSRSRAGQDRFGQRESTPPSSRTSACPQTGQSVGNRKSVSSPVRASSTTRTTWGMIFPAFSTTTRSPSFTPSRAISSALCRLARETVVPAISTGSSSATGVTRPVLPTWYDTPFSRVWASHFSHL